MEHSKKQMLIFPFNPNVEVVNPESEYDININPDSDIQLFLQYKKSVKVVNLSSLIRKAEQLGLIDKLILED